MRIKIIIFVVFTLHISAAHAQWGGFLQSIIQSNQQEQIEKNRKADERDKNPTKNWGDIKPAPAKIVADSKKFSEGVKNTNLQPYLERLYIEGERNATLNFKRLGLAALNSKNYDIAEVAFDQAIERINTIYADDPAAEKARSLWSNEKVKDFKGEPYERSMAFYYRGLLYASKSDFQNARAMFKQAEYQDTVAESEKFSSDFGLMQYMASWVSSCDGDNNLASDFYKASLASDSKFSDLQFKNKTLIILEADRAPFKYGAGKHEEALKWHPRNTEKSSIKSVCTDKSDIKCLQANFVEAGDIGFQATTRGGRQMDAVLNGKASFKEGAQDVADIATTVGAASLEAALATGNQDLGNIGLVGMFAGLLAQGASSLAQAKADVREWDQLPGKIWIATLPNSLTESELVANLETSDDSKKLTSLSRMGDSNSCQLYWGQALSSSDSTKDMGPIDYSDHKRNAVFRDSLMGIFSK